MADVHAKTESIGVAAQNFATQSVQLADLIKAVQTHIENLEGEWSGPAHSQFVSLMAQWHTDVNGIQDVLDQVAQRVKAAGLGYDDLESQINRSFQY